MNIHKASRATKFSTGESWVGRVVVVSVSGDLDALTAPDLAAAIQAGVRQKPDALIVDLSNVQFLASAGMGVLIASGRDIGPVRFGVVADGPATRRPLALIGIDTMVAVHYTLDEAVRTGA